MGMGLEAGVWWCVQAAVNVAGAGPVLLSGAVVRGRRGRIQGHTRRHTRYAQRTRLEGDECPEARFILINAVSVAHPPLSIAPLPCALARRPVADLPDWPVGVP
jgi:hypothetical protein